MTYVLSDIHGNLQRFESIMTQINLQTNDTLYVLGDVIDRYAGGIKILRQIMRMPNAEMLIGNHEYMMLNAIGHCKDAVEEKENTNRREKRLWYRNGGMITHEQLKHYRKDIRAEIFDFIRQLPTNLEVEVNGIKYKLVHASPEENYIKSPWNIYDYKNSREFAIWDRWDETQPIPEGYVLIFGHTPTCYFHDKVPWCIWKGDNAIGIAICEAYIESNLSLYSTDHGAFMEKIYKALPWLKLWNAPNLFSMDEDLDAGEKPEYPEPRGLDSLKVRVKRQGKICKLTFTDLCEDEQLFALSCMSKEEIKTLMMQLACSMQRLVNLFDIRRNQDGQLTAKGKEHLLIQQ